MISLYVMYFGVALALMGSVELTFRERAFRFWLKWFRHRFFSLHGVLLIALGFPLTFYKGAWSTFVFIVGLVMVLTGPFILIYPEKMRKSFDDISQEAGDGALRGLVAFDAFARVAIGAAFAWCAMLPA